MNDIETHSSGSNPDLELVVESLQRQVFLLLLGLIIVTATVVFYLCYQARTTGADLENSRQRANLLIQGYQREAPAIKNFDQQINSYALTHPDFQRVLAKYGWTPGAVKQQAH
jgi:hypothetical protein